MSAAISDREIFCATKLLIDQRGDDSTTFAARRADLLLERAPESSGAALAVMVDGFDMGEADDGRLVLTLQFDAAGQLNFGFELEDADTLARAILGTIGRSDGRAH
jgi:hypothetical protein